MKTQLFNNQNRSRKWFGGLAALCAAVFVQYQALADITLTLVDGNGAAVAAPFRWQLEEDNTDLSIPGTGLVNSPSLVIHKSNAAVMANGEITAAPMTIPTDPGRRYVLSILKDGYSVGGNSIAIGQTTVGVVLNKHPIPTAEISILVFKDQQPDQQCAGRHRSGPARVPCHSL